MLSLIICSQFQSHQQNSKGESKTKVQSSKNQNESKRNQSQNKSNFNKSPSPKNNSQNQVTDRTNVSFMVGIMWVLLCHSC